VSDAHAAIQAVWRIESPRLIAGLTRLVRDVGVAEDLAQDALVAALEQWPGAGVPDNPGAWLMATAKHRAIDGLRRAARLERKHEELGRELPEGEEADYEAVLDDGVEDDLLRLIFMTCHPVLSREARVALTLRLLGGLVALMELQASRLRARVGAGGAPVLLLDQDRSRWDRLLIVRGLAALRRAETLGGTLGPYGLQAAIAACHARARTAEETDWVRIAALYDALCQLAPSPVVELNRAVAVAMAFGPAAGLELVDALAGEPALDGYHLLPSVRGELLARLGRDAEARTELDRAAALTRNERVRELLLARIEATNP
jgi:predicted RNA polymerase sigma factor